MLPGKTSSAAGVASGAAELAGKPAGGAKALLAGLLELHWSFKFAMALAERTGFTLPRGSCCIVFEERQ